MNSVRLSVPFFSQFDTANVERAGDTACYRACRAMCDRVGVVIPESTLGRIQVASGVTTGNRVIVDPAGGEAAWVFIEEQIAKSIPVVMGVNYKPGSPNRDHITDHFVLIVGWEMAAVHEPVGRDPMAAWGEYKRWLVFDPAHAPDKLRHLSRWMQDGKGMIRVEPDGPTAEMSMVVPHVGMKR